MTSMDARRVPPPSAAAEIGQLLDSHEIAGLIGELDELRWTGRPGYSNRSLVGACLVKAIYAIPTWTRTVALIGEHRALQDALGDAPSVYACYRFATKLRAHGDLLDACIARVLASLRAELPEMGRAGPTSPPTPTGSGSSPRVAESASGSPTPTLPGGTAPRFRLARAGASTGTRSTRPSARV